MEISPPRGVTYTSRTIYNSPLSRISNYFSVRRGFRLEASTESGIRLGNIKVLFSDEDYDRIAAMSVFSWYDNDRNEEIYLNNTDELITYAKQVSPAAIMRWSDSPLECNAIIIASDGKKFCVQSTKEIFRDQEIVLEAPKRKIIDYIVSPTKSAQKRRTSQRSPPSGEPGPKIIKPYVSPEGISKAVTPTEISPKVSKVVTPTSPVVTSVPQINLDIESPTEVTPEKEKQVTPEKQVASRDAVSETLQRTIEVVDDAIQIMNNIASGVQTSKADLVVSRDYSPDKSNIPENFTWKGKTVVEEEDEVIITKVVETPRLVLVRPEVATPYKTPKAKPKSKKKGKLLSPKSLTKRRTPPNTIKSMFINQEKIQSEKKKKRSGGPVIVIEESDSEEETETDEEIEEGEEVVQTEEDTVIVGVLENQDVQPDMPDFPTPVNATPSGPEEKIRAKSLSPMTQDDIFQTLSPIMQLSQEFQDVSMPPNQEQMAEVQRQFFDSKESITETEYTPKIVRNVVSIDLTGPDPSKDAQLDAVERTFGQQKISAFLKRPEMVTPTEIFIPPAVVVLKPKETTPVQEIISLSTITPQDVLAITTNDLDRIQSILSLSNETISQETEEKSSEKSTYERLLEGKNIDHPRKLREKKGGVKKHSAPIFRLVNTDPVQSGFMLSMNLKNIRDRNDLVCAARDAAAQLQTSENSSYQTLSFKGIKRSFVCMALFFALGKNSRVVDLGSGYGNIVFQAALNFKVAAVHGIDIGLMGFPMDTEEGTIIPVDKVTYYASIMMKNIIKSKVPQVAAEMNKILFYCSDAGKINIRDYTHIISFNTLWDASDIKPVLEQIMSVDSKMIVFACTKDIMSLEPRKKTRYITEKELLEEQDVIDRARQALYKVGNITVESAAGGSFQMYFFVKATHRFKYEQIFEGTPLNNENFEKAWSQVSNTRDDLIEGVYYMHDLDQSKKGYSVSSSRKSSGKKNSRREKNGMHG